MRIVLAGHQPCQVQGRGVEALVESAVEDLGMGFWFGGKRGVVQEAYLLATMNFRLSHPQLPFWQISGGVLLQLHTLKSLGKPLARKPAFRRATSGEFAPCN